MRSAPGCCWWRSSDGIDRITANLRGDGGRKPLAAGGLIGALALFAVSAGVISIAAVAVVIFSRDIR